MAQHKYKRLVSLNHSDAKLSNIYFGQISVLSTDREWQNLSINTRSDKNWFFLGESNLLFGMFEPARDSQDSKKNHFKGK